MLLNDTRYKLQIWDPSGNPRFHSISTSYFRNGKIFFLVYDVTQSETLVTIMEQWITDVNKCMTPETRMMLIGNKADVEADERVGVHIVCHETMSSYSYFYLSFSK